MAKRRLPELLHSLSAWVAPARGEAGPERPAEDRGEGALQLVRRPMDRSLLWLPGGWGEQATSRPYPNELFVEHDVLRDVEIHALEENVGSYGLLTGRFLACDQTRIPFVSVEAAHRSESPMPVGEDLTSFREFFWEVREAARRRGRVVVGWYHTHSLLGLRLSERDRQIHVAHFHDDWACALVVVTRKGASQGGFFQRDRGDILFRRSTRPFRELVNQRVQPGGGPYVTSVAWDNYWTNEPVLHARKPGDPPSTAGKSSWGRRPRVEPRSARPLADLVGGAAEEPGAVDSSTAESTAAVSSVQPPGPRARTGDAARPESAGPVYERAMGRPARHDGVIESGRTIPAGPPSQKEWDEWKRSVGARRAREDEIRRAEAERAEADAAKAVADADARAKAALAARAAAEAAARAASAALGIGSERDAIAAEAVPMAEADAEALVPDEQAAGRAAIEGTEKVASAPQERKPKEKQPEQQPEVEEAVDVGAAAVEIDDKRGAAGEEGAAAAAIVEPEVLPEAGLGMEEADRAGAEVMEPAAERGAEPGPEVEVGEEVGEEVFTLEVAADEAEPDRGEGATPEEEASGGGPSRELAAGARVAARSFSRPAADGEMVVPPLVMPDPLPRTALRRYAAWLGIGLPLAAAVAWFLLG